MSERKIILPEDDYVAALDAIRSKRNSTQKYKSSDLAAVINGIASSGGIDTSDGTATAADIVKGAIAYSQGARLVGTYELPASVTQATPSISVSTSGLITASSTQRAGLVSAGTKSATKQLTTQAAKTITPSTSNQTAVAKNVYTTGAITVAGDANLTPENIAKGKTIFGVTGTAETKIDYNKIFEDARDIPWSVKNVSGYSFVWNGNYYESNNKGQDNSYALCRVDFTTKTNNTVICFEVINYAESNFDFAIFSQLDKTLSQDTSEDTSNVHKSFKGQQSSSVVELNYTVAQAGSHYIYVKFRKDGSQSTANDSCQFRIKGSPKDPAFNSELLSV